MSTIYTGQLLIAEPFLKDPSFERSVVLICRHDDVDGTFGFTINKFIDVTVDEVIDDMNGWPLPLFLGGPVEHQKLHFIHQYPDLIPDAVKVADGIYWGGDFEILKSLIFNGTITSEKIKFFLGYSGWDAQQLQDEIAEGAWFTTAATTALIFNTPAPQVWASSLQSMGGKYAMMVHLPTDPQLN
ncbi:YqgE/AlgH family protein [Ferruginibacter yonginensis]|uniref:UPF0301 protein ACFOWM_11055 n=1 Tax=Ferruginibacter yonginensis TaxID=1310416 RepID=A0ABV8QT06_9BACT